MSFETMKVTARNLEIGDELTDGSYVSDIFSDADGIWLETDGAYVDAGYVEPTDKFTVTRYFDWR